MIVNNFVLQRNTITMPLSATHSTIKATKQTLQKITENQQDKNHKNHFVVRFVSFVIKKLYQCSFLMAYKSCCQSELVEASPPQSKQSLRQAQTDTVLTKVFIRLNKCEMVLTD